MVQDLHTNTSKYGGVKFYIINGRVTTKKIDYISYQGYLMGYEATTGVFIYWNLDQYFDIHISHHVWFDEYNSRIYI